MRRSREEFLDGISAGDELDGAAGVGVEVLGGVDAHFRIERGGKILRGMDVFGSVIAARIGRSEHVTARNAGTIAIAVNYGFGLHDRAAHPADVYLDRLTDLVPLLADPAVPHINGRSRAGRAQ